MFSRYSEETDRLQLQSLPDYIRRFPDSENRAEAEYYLGALLLRLDEPEKSLLHFSRQLFLYPDRRFSRSSLLESIKLIHSNRSAWKKEWQKLTDAFREDHFPPYGSRDADGNAKLYTRYLDLFHSLETDTFRKLYIDEVMRFMEEYPDHPDVAEYLFQAAGHCSSLGDSSRAITLYAALAASYPDSPLRPQALLQTALLLEKQFRGEAYAHTFFMKVIDEHPGSREAETAEELLSDNNRR